MTVHRFRYPKGARLKKAWQFDYLFRTGRRIRGELVRLLFITSPDGTTQLGVAVGKRQGNSPKRSRGRRILKESFRRLLPWVKDGYWVVCTPRTEALGISARKAYQDISSLMFRAGLLNEDWPGPDWDIDGRISADENAG